MAGGPWWSELCGDVGQTCWLLCRVSSQRERGAATSSSHSLCLVTSSSMQQPWLRDPDALLLEGPMSP